MVEAAVGLDDVGGRTERFGGAPLATEAVRIFFAQVPPITLEDGRRKKRHKARDVHRHFYFIFFKRSKLFFHVILNYNWGLVF